MNGESCEFSGKAVVALASGLCLVYYVFYHYYSLLLIQIHSIKICS